MKLNTIGNDNRIFPTKTAIVHFNLHWLGSHDGEQAIKAVMAKYPSTTVQRKKRTFLGLIRFSLPSTTFIIENIAESTTQDVLGNDIVRIMEKADFCVDKLTVDFVAPGGYVYNNLVHDWKTRRSRAFLPYLPQ